MKSRELLGERTAQSIYQSNILHAVSALAIRYRLSLAEDLQKDQFAVANAVVEDENRPDAE